MKSYGGTLKFILITVFFFALIMAGILIVIPLFSTTTQNIIPELPPDIPEITTPDYNSDYEQITVTPDNVRSVISALNRPEQYYMETESYLTYDSGTASYLRRKWVKGDVSRVDIMTNAENVSSYNVFKNDTVYIWRENGRVHSFPRGDFSADTTQMMMEYEDILRHDNTDITAASYTAYNGSPCIFIQAVNEVGYVEKYWVSTRNGLLLCGQTLSDGRVFYSVYAKKIDVSEISDELFTVPE